MNWLCAMELRLRFSHRDGLELGTARSVGQRLTHCATGVPPFSGGQLIVYLGNRSKQHIL